MSGKSTLRFLRAGWLAAPCVAALCVAALAAMPCRALPRLPLHADKPTVQALMVSDIHFEPFWDPDKTTQLAEAAPGGWNAILATPNSADREQRFSALQSECHVRGQDTSYPLFASSLKAMRADAKDAGFVTVSGDLIAHGFSCKYKKLFPKSSPDDYRAFVEKTIEFVMGSLRGTFPRAPVYAALGNNDSDCGDYQLDADSQFLEDMGGVFTADLPEPELTGLPELERKKAAKNFADGGYYSASLPIHHARIVVLDDLFMARKYATCDNKPDPQEAAAQIVWLKRELNHARKNKEKIWVMAHIPPGVDPYSTISKAENICGGKSPQMFLSSDALGDAIAGYGDVIPLAIFAHTHMDEMRLLEPGGKDSGHGPVAVKMVPSISPVDGNNPAFTVAQVDTETGVLMNYHVIAASNQTGVGTKWSQEYDYAKAYQEPSFVAGSVENLFAEFKADPSAQSEVSQNYLKDYFVGDKSRELKLFWPQYVCALDNQTESSYRTCSCAAK
ncbi:MAG TPA: metallophosphoesterase [Terracidiphilus sp.]|nr:metallophosphoesterase [Terracidiphilus sp.]